MPKPIHADYGKTQNTEEACMMRRRSNHYGHCAERQFEQCKIDIMHRYPLSDMEEAYRKFENHPDSVIRIAIMG